MGERKGTKALEIWCKRLTDGYPNVKVENMTTSWRNGLAFCALVHHFKPELIDFSSLKPENVYDNNALAYQIAEQHLGIPSLLDPEDMVSSEIPDRLSILTYLSQYYQRLGSPNVSKQSSIEEEEVKPKPAPRHTVINLEKLKTGRSSYEVCAVCELPVYLAQRLLYQHKLYHRRCFQCSKCNMQLSPVNVFHDSQQVKMFCESCFNADELNYHDFDDKIGMVMYEDENNKKDENNKNFAKYRPATQKQSVLDKISAFEKLDLGSKPKLAVEKKQSNITYDIVDGQMTSDENKTIESISNKVDSEELSQPIETNTYSDISKQNTDKINSIVNVHKSDIDKLNFLQTQLSTDKLTFTNKVLDHELEENNESIETPSPKPRTSLSKPDSLSKEVNVDKLEMPTIVISNSDDTFLNNIANEKRSMDDITLIENEDEKYRVPPPRRKNTDAKTMTASSIKNELKNVSDNKKVTSPEVLEYPEDLNPFSDNEEEEDVEINSKQKSISTNPFGSSSEDEDEDNITSITNKRDSQTNVSENQESLNPFWSDGEEPEDEAIPSMKSSKFAASTPNISILTPRKKKKPAPKPPVYALQQVVHDSETANKDDEISISSLSSHCSTINSDYKSYPSLTRKKRPAPSTPDCPSIISNGSHRCDTPTSLSSYKQKASVKGPAPGLPLPERRNVKMLLSPDSLTTELDLLETQHQGLEKQGVLIEQMIRDKCEGSNGSEVPQEEVEDLVIQLCELVNEKNDLFRRQAELMFIRRQQRLEQEQADIEHEIRVIQSRPAVNRIDADKAREEYLVSRLVNIVKQRDALVQQVEDERRREHAEDEAIAVSIAQARAKRISDHSIPEAKSHKKNKVKDRVKKQLKKAKSTLNPKKKSDSSFEGETSSVKANKKSDKTKWYKSH